MYLKGSGGLELHVNDDKFPIDTNTSDMLDFDAVFREKYDQSTYSLYVGCGGCMKVDPIVRPPVHLNGYEEAELEPFTQTRYFSVFEKKNRKFDVSLLHPSVCDQGHFTIRLTDHGNRSDGRPIVWGPVIGLLEDFSLEEIVSFPSYILANHGSSWNDMEYTRWISFFMIAPLCILWWRSVGSTTGDKPLTSMPIVISMGDNYMPEVTLRQVDPREGLYDFAILCFVAAGVEEMIHLFYAQIGMPVRGMFWVGFLGVILIAQGLPILFVSFVWETMLKSREPQDSKLVDDCTWCSSSATWAPIELLTGMFFLGLFGAGFYGGPIAIMLAAIVRMSETWGHTVDTYTTVRYIAPRGRSLQPVTGVPVVEGTEEKGDLPPLALKP